MKKKATILDDKKQEEGQQLSVALDVFEEARSFITAGIADVDKTIEGENTLVIGNTRGGKSTIINYLLSNPLKVAKLDPNAKGKDGKVLKIFAVDPTAGPEIGATGGSMTTVPKKWYNSDGAYKKTIWDCPGFGDNRGPAVDISNAYLLSKLLSNAKNIKIVLVSDIKDITNDNPAGFVGLIKQVNYLFGDLDKIKDCSILLVTKVKNYDVHDITVDIKKIAKNVQDPELDKAFIQHLANNEKITIFTKAKKEGLLDSKDAEMIAKDINQINSEQQLAVKVGISPDTKVFIYKNSSLFSNFIKEDLDIILARVKALVDVDKIEKSEDAHKAIEHLKEISAEFNTNDHNESMKEFLERIHNILIREGQTALENSGLNSKLDLLAFIKSIIDIRTLDIECFKNDLKNTGCELIEKITMRKLMLENQENKITKEQMEKQIAETQTIVKMTQDNLQKQNEEMRKLQDKHNEDMAKLAKDNAALLKAQNDAFQNQLYKVVQEQNEQMRKIQNEYNAQRAKERAEEKAEMARKEAEYREEVAKREADNAAYKKEMARKEAEHKAEVAKREADAARLKTQKDAEYKAEVAKREADIVAFKNEMARKDAEHKAEMARKDALKNQTKVIHHYHDSDDDSFCNIMYATKEEYDNPLLNKPRVIEEYISKFGKKSFDDLLTLTSQLEKTEVKEVLEQQNPVDSLAMLMGLDSEVYN
ncbi:hypothetical protein [Candidatus Tisiphia endosymbiont of Temnostethus pusillus]|uniref:hypothetical protein n=1 Tax=Candidatus Tisiphia endosymbiont of Temnostethus pusillus TaxID=3139335 RepID=UPI0035C933C3